MRHNKIIYLGTKTTELDDDLNQIETFDYSNKVFANEYSISSSEYYAGAVADLKPEKSFEIYSFEYNGEERFKFDGQEYEVIRTQGKGEKIRLIGEKVVSNG
jgi:hypothetical protein